MSDFIPIDELGERTTIAETDIVHIRSTGKIDSKMTVLNFFKNALAVIFGSVQTDNVAVKQKLFTGTCDAGGNISILSTGLVATKVLDIRAYYLNGTSYYLLTDAIAGTGEHNQMDNVGNIHCVGSSLSANDAYRLFVTYEA